jgi:hypothetical protein
MISLAHKTVFIHIPKAGGQSVEAAFCTSLGLDWALHRRLLLCMEKPKSWHGRTKRTAHLTALEYLEGAYLPAPVFASFFKFATVRDPYRKIESHYFYGLHDKKMSFEKFCLRFIPKVIKKGDPFFAPQTTFVTDRENNLIVDHIYKLETLAADWPEIQSRAEMKAELGHQNRSQNRNPTLISWSPDMKARIRQLYQADFERFGYE